MKKESHREILLVKISNTGSKGKGDLVELFVQSLLAISNFKD